MPDAPDLNLDSILRKENLNELSQLDPDFYEKASKLIEELEAEKSRAEPDSLKYEFANDRLETTKAKVRDIINTRMHNINRIASSQSSKKDKDKSQDTSALTREDLELYEGLVKLMTGWTKNRFDQVFKKGQVTKEIAEKEIAVPQEQKEPRKPEVSKESPKESPKEGPKEKHRDTSNYITVRLLKDVPTFVGMDNRNYTLAKEDVALVPVLNANALITKKAAVQVGIKKY